MHLGCLWLTPQVMDSCTTHLLLQLEGFKGQGVTKGGAHQRMIKGRVSQETRNQSQLGNRALAPCCLVLSGVLQRGHGHQSNFWQSPAQPPTEWTALQYKAYPEGDCGNFSPQTWNTAREWVPLLLWCLSSCLFASYSDCGL